MGPKSVEFFMGPALAPAPTEPNRPAPAGTCFGYLHGDDIKIFQTPKKPEKQIQATVMLTGSEKLFLKLKKKFTKL